MPDYTDDLSALWMLSFVSPGYQNWKK